jgi:hypothetical protein
VNRTETVEEFLFLGYLLYYGKCREKEKGRNEEKGKKGRTIGEINESQVVDYKR